MQLFSEDPGASLTVRAVAERAGVSTGSLRYHFPTQRELLDEVAARFYELTVPGENIQDRSIPARDRLVACLRGLIAQFGVGESARTNMCRVVSEFVAPEPSDALRASYLAIERETQRRVEHWLQVLVDQDALGPGDNAARTRFLLTVINGLTLERALPRGGSPLQIENETLYSAVDALLASGRVWPR
ncbi:helix-turn-helix transcriptional regulator [Pseudonocardia sp. ICBG1122]|nr:helix-turn-helix transcriptional regulator [Pseudonocardia pini]